MSKFRGVKTNNAKTSAKTEIRNHILSAIDHPKVLEVFCGSGEMYQAVWIKADEYTGIDKVKYFDDRNTICGDARKAIRKIDLNEFNIFDIDAYGSPYEILNDILTLSEFSHDKIGFVITDGVDMDLKLGRICKGIRMMTDIDCHIAKRANTMHDSIIKMVVDEVARRLFGRAEGFKMATGKTGSHMKYYGFIINRDAA